MLFKPFILGVVPAALFSLAREIAELKLEILEINVGRSFLRIILFFCCNVNFNTVL